MDSSIVGGASDRRRHPRHTRAEEHGIVSARLRPRHPVRLVDISAHGALIESTHRLLPNSAAELQILTSDGRVSARGRLSRCAVAGLRPHAVLYRGAVVF